MNRRTHGRRPHARETLLWARLATGCTILAGLLAIEFGPAAVGCGIKGNISYNTGKKIITFLDRTLTGRRASTY